MIHQLLHLTRPLFVVDCETTGINPETDRIIEIGFQRWEASGMTREWRSLVSAGVPIPEDSTAKHNITNESISKCRKCGKHNLDIDHAKDGACEYLGWPTFAQLASHLAVGFSNCDFAGKHVRFDLRIIAAEMVRAGQEWSYRGARIIDADRLEALGEPRTLSHLYKKHTGREMEHAHEALADVRATTELIVAQLKLYHTLPRDLDHLHELQWPNWIDVEGKFQFVNGVPCFSSWGKWAHWPMHKIEVSYWDYILKSNFPTDVKQLARDAKLRKFPEPPK